MGKYLAPARGNTFDLRTKGGNSRQESSVSGILPESLTTRSFLMYRLRQMDVDDKVCEQVDMTLLAQVYPKEAIERCVGQSQPWASKARRMRQSTLLALVLLVIGMALWSRLSQRLVWDKLVGKLSALHPGEPQSQLSASALSGRRKALGSQGLQALLHECCRVLAQPQTMPGAFFGRYRLMAIDGTVFNTADTQANEAAGCRAAAITMAKAPIHRCAVCCWPSVAVMPSSSSRSAATTSQKCMARTACSTSSGGTRWCWWTPGSPRAGFWSTRGSAGCRCWGRWKQACGSTCLANGAWPMARCWSGCPPHAQARRTIRCSVACGCASFPIG